MRTGVIVIKLLLLLLVARVICACSDKKYGYAYFEKGEELNTVKAMPFKPNDFKINFQLALDSVILNKEIPSPVLVNVNISGQHQYWPKDLKIELYCNGKMLQFQDSTKRFTISTVINNQVRYFEVNAEQFDIPSLLVNAKQEQNIPDSVGYFKVSCGLKSEYYRSDQNPKEIEVKLKASWNGGTETIEKIFILTKVDITKYPSHPRLYG